VEQYLDILAFDLKANGVDLTGKPALTPDMLPSIVIHPWTPHPGSTMWPGR